MQKFLILLAAIAGAGFIFLTDQHLVIPSTMTATSTVEEVISVQEVSIHITPDTVLQGDPVLITIEGLGATTSVKSLTYRGKTIGVFEHLGRPSALIGIDLREPAQTYPIILTLSDGRVLKKDLKTGARVIAKAPLGIPETLGGNTPESEKELLATLVQEGAIISAVKSGPEKLWDGSFRLPLDSPITITDVYGYTRLTGGSSISHKGTDFRAVVGTPVYAANSGKVALTTYLRNYGNVIIIDHGLGLLTIYMHLSEIAVKTGEMVKEGEFIAKSGETGYVLGPHLHLTVRINGVSIDPMKFLALFEER